MRTLDFPSYLLSVLAAAILLPSCGGSQGQIPAGSGSSSARRIASASDASGPLLYVAHTHRPGRHAYSTISILSLRQDKLLATISGYGYISGVCSDALGNVWVPNLRHGHWEVDEFSRGGTKSIAELAAPPRWLSFADCGVDPKSGDLAVMGANIDGVSYAVIWAGARGKPAMYSTGFCPLNAAYDDAGNLFIIGWGCGSDFNFEFGELANGSDHVVQVKLDERTGAPGGVQWDGTDVVVATTADRGNRQRPVLYRVHVSGPTGKVVGVTPVHGFYDRFFLSPDFALNDKTVIGVAGGSGENVSAWPYPAGGNPTRSIATYQNITGIALSR